MADINVDFQSISRVKVVKLPAEIRGNFQKTRRNITFSDLSQVTHNQHLHFISNDLERF